ncbi:hypothetical protein AVEN_114574-1, partial [Araneus ventricosus]
EDIKVSPKYCAQESKPLMKVPNHHQLSVKQDEPKSFSSSTLSGWFPRYQIFTVKYDFRRVVESMPGRIAALHWAKAVPSRY